MKQDNSSNVTAHVIQVLTINGADGEDPGDASIILEGVKMLSGFHDTANVCLLLMGLVYVLNLACPKTLCYTFEVFKKLFLKLDGIKVSPKMQKCYLEWCQYTYTCPPIFPSVHLLARRWSWGGKRVVELMHWSLHQNVHCLL